MLLRNDYSKTDNALSLWATIMMTSLAVTSLALRCVISPVTCWCPAQFQDFHVRYTEEACNKDSAYYMPNFDQVHTLRQGQDAQFRRIGAHHWVPLALGAGALLCLLPHMLWSSLSPLWFDSHALLSSLKENQSQAAGSRHALLRDTTILLTSVLNRGNCVLTLAALCRKLLACLTCVFHLGLVVRLFEPQLGWNAPTDSDAPLPFGPFLCDFQIRQRQNVQAYTVQCVWRINKVYQYILAFVFYVFLLLLILCTLDLLLWIGRLLVPGLRDVAVKRQLGAMTGGESDGAVSQLYPRFAQRLGLDGRLLLALTADFCGPLAAADLTIHLWTVFQQTTKPVFSGATPLPVDAGPRPAGDVTDGEQTP